MQGKTQGKTHHLISQLPLNFNTAYVILTGLATDIGLQLPERENVYSQSGFDRIARF
jgi:hypothetical protein